jgi:cellobiose-specific phosphotransferase system component IIC
MTTQYNDDMEKPNLESLQAEAAAEAAWRKMRVVTRIMSIGGILVVFDVGKALWPSWLVAHQLQAFLAIMLLVVLSMLAAPHVAAAVARSHANPREKA